jgi:hypothetical protein
MKSKYFILVFSFSFLFACNKSNDLFDVMPESDIVALEGMDEAYNNALIYNDSLQQCADEPTSCNDATVAHYDEFFHQFDDLFDQHHEDYSHNNMGDDHHHEGGNNVRHGSMMGDDDHCDHCDDDDDDDDDGDHEYEHNMETFEMMMQLREMHENVHPG